MTGSGQSLPRYPAAGPPDVGYAPNRHQNVAAPRMVAMCHSRHFASQKNSVLFDHLVGAGEQRRWGGQTERLGSVQVEH